MPARNLSSDIDVAVVTHVHSNTGELIQAIGVDRIRSHNLDMTSLIVERLSDRVTSPHDVNRRSGTAIIRTGVEAVEILAAADIHVDHRGDGIRVSPDVHTSEQAIDQLLATVAPLTPY